MENLTKWQMVLGILGGLVAAGALLLAAYYFLVSSYIDPGDDPERMMRRSAPKASSLQPSQWRVPTFDERGVTPNEDGKPLVWSAIPAERVGT